MPFATEREAKQFLADKIYQQSQSAGEPLSDVDRRLLLFSEQDPGSEEGFQKTCSMPTLTATGSAG